MSIRPATDQDAAAICGLWNPVIAETEITFNSVPWSVPALRALLADKAAAGHPFLVADPGGVAGFATYGPFRAGVGYARTMEHTIILAPGARGRGVGRALMAGLEAHARAAGVLSLWAGIVAGNRDGIAFHAAIGFEPVARLPEVGWKFDRCYDLVLMRKPLSPPGGCR
ncbi:MAG TPA: GNAT family N-acetyltransferase [Rhodobacteraceae bacterium]|jgi:L-amino acid N-acyltransferase YncA|nr:N-acetyltransferase [Paracoccaceae bacterium]HBG98148.1 GNAT family N-acetyltransferase [Paracoccaceae bacterium]